MKQRLRLFTFIILCCFATIIYSQENRNKPYITNASIEEQFNYVIDESSRWEVYKMVLERWINQLRTNTSDTINSKNLQISNLKDSIQIQKLNIASLEAQMNLISQQLDNTVKEKNSFEFFGISLQKRFFLSVVIFLIIGSISIIGFISFLYQKNLTATKKSKDELAELKEDFENYRQKTRKKQEDLVIKHHREIQKIKGMI